MLTFLRDHWRALIVPLALLCSFGAGRCTAPEVTGEAEFIEVPGPTTRDLTVENQLRAQLEQAQRDAAAAKSSSTSSARFTAPDGSKIELQCDASAETVEVHEATQENVAAADQQVRFHEVDRPVLIKVPGSEPLWGGTLMLGAKFSEVKLTSPLDAARVTGSVDYRLGKILGITWKGGGYVRTAPTKLLEELEAGIILRGER
jgi:hypothetical protein